MVNAQTQGCVNMKPRPLPRRMVKPWRKPKRRKLNLKEYNIDALVSNIRQSTPGYCCSFCKADIIQNPKRYRKRLFRKESAYISR